MPTQTRADNKETQPRNTARRPFPALGRGLSQGERRLDEGEFLDVFNATPDEVNGWCRDGSIIDCKTLVGALWLQNVLSGVWSLDWSGAMPADVAR